MSTVAHFINVGQGNMTLLQLDDGTNILYDCNVTDENRNRVINYLANVVGKRRIIHKFVCSHREADHMRGLAVVHRNFPIQTIWDTDVPGGTTGSTEYKQYMDLKRRLKSVVIKQKTFYDFGKTKIRIINAKSSELPNDPNAQSVVLKVQQHHPQSGKEMGSLMLCGDTNAVSWINIMKRYDAIDLKSDILLASHHGSITFFDDPSNEKNYYTEHIKAIKPDITIVSVGPNAHGHPDSKAIELYGKYSSGSKNGNKTFRTDKSGNIRVELRDNDGWGLKQNQ